MDETVLKTIAKKLESAKYDYSNRGNGESSKYPLSEFIKDIQGIDLYATYNEYGKKCSLAYDIIQKDTLAPYLEHVIQTGQFDIDRHFSDGYSKEKPLFYHIKSRDQLGIVKKLLKYGAQIPDASHNGASFTSNLLQGNHLDKIPAEQFAELKALGCVFEDDDGSLLHSHGHNKHFKEKYRSLLVDAGVDITKKDKNGKSGFALYRTQLDIDDEITQAVHTNSFEKKGWTYEQTLSVLHTNMYREACGLPTSLDQPDPGGWLKKYNELNKIHDHAGQFVSNRSPLVTAGHISDFLNVFSRQILLPAFFHAYPQAIEAYYHTVEYDQPIDYNSHPPEKDHPYNYFDDRLTDSLQHIAGQMLFGEKPQKKGEEGAPIPAVAVPNILKATNRWSRNRAAISAAAKNLPEYKASEWPTLSGPVKSDNGLWLVPIGTSQDLENEGDALDHCVSDYESQCIHGLRVVSVRREKSVPAFTGALIPDKNKKLYENDTNPLGYGNKRANPKILAAWNWYLDSVNKGTWGDPAEKILEGEDYLRLSNSVLDARVINIGFHPTHTPSRRKAWDAWQSNMGDTIRYHHDDLETMLQRSGVYDMFRPFAQHYKFKEALVM